MAAVHCASLAAMLMGYWNLHVLTVIFRRKCKRKSTLFTLQIFIYRTSYEGFENMPSSTYVLNYSRNWRSWMKLAKTELDKIFRIPFLPSFITTESDLLSSINPILIQFGLHCTSRLLLEMSIYQYPDINTLQYYNVGCLLCSIFYLWIRINHAGPLLVF